MIYLGNGIEYVGKARIYLDGKREEGVNVISHAHRDHLGNVKRAIASKETAILAGLEGYKEGLCIDDTEIKLHDAGHILGSRQVEVLDGNNVVYTGDIRLRESFFSKGAEILNPDILIIESTFGLPNLVFPPQDEVISSIERWIKANLSIGRHVVIGGYELGKSQELTRLVNNMGEVPVVTKEISKYNQIYSDLGVKIGEWITAGEQGDDPNVFIVPMRMVRKARAALSVSGRDVATAVATGWAVAYPFKAVDKAFPLSDHADFNELVRYAKESEAKRILVTHGYQKELARWLRKLGLNAQPLNKKPKTI